MFRDVLDLVPQSSVKVNDVSVGKVTDVRLDGYTADVTRPAAPGTELPDNAVATIRQTSLLGEKFVSLAAPESGASTEPLASGDVIPLERSGRNPEVEEVLGALSLLLNGGGVAQLRTIARELNIALEGREGTARSVLDQVRLLMTQLDDNKADIVNAIDKLNDLSVSINKQRDTIDAALEELPSALVSIDKQRDDLVKMLEALADLSDVGVRVIQASKAATIDSLQQLNPVLTADRRIRRRLRQRVQRVPDLPVRRRGRRPRPAGRPQPPHGRLHQPVDHPRHQHRHRHHAADRSAHRPPDAADRPADHAADDPRPDGDPRRRPGLPPERRPDQPRVPEGAGHPGEAARSCARSAPSRRTRTRRSASSSPCCPGCRRPTAHCRSRCRR